MKTAQHRGKGSRVSLQHFLRPHNLDLSSIIPKEAESRWTRKTCQGKLAYVVHTLCDLRAKFRAKPEAFVSLSQAHLVPIIGTRYTSASLQILQQAGVIECDRRCKPGLRSMGYRFTLAYRTAVDTYPPVERVATKGHLLNQKRVLAAIGDDPDHRFIFECLKSLSFAPEVESFLSSPELEEVERAALRLSYENLKRERFEFATDPKTGRVFHNVTNMAKSLRAYLRLNGERCEELDLANAQPLLLLSAWSPETTAVEERQRFAKLVSQGAFYEHINELAGSPYDSSNSEQRARLKRAFQQQVMSGKNHYTGRLKDAFAKSFPHLSRFIAQEKQQNHAALSLRLQRVESELVVHRVIARLRHAHPHVKVVTIHDALLCAASAADTVAAVFSEEATRLLGVAPTLKRKEQPAQS